MGLSKKNKDITRNRGKEREKKTLRGSLSGLRLAMMNARLGEGFQLVIN